MLNHGLKFLVTGMSGLLVDMALLGVLVEFLEVPISLAKAMAAEMAMINNFTWNHLWTFSGRQSRQFSLIVRFLRFNLVCGIGILIAILVLHILHHHFNINLYLANFAAIIISAGWNFLLSLAYVWNSETE